MNKFILAMLIVCLPTFTFANEQQSSLTEEEKYRAWATSIWDSLDKQTGAIEITQAGATLNVPENFYYLNSADAEKVLVEVWGNPPDPTTLGMLFPATMTPFDADSWAVTVQYEENGYVSDENADEIDYNELLDAMKADTAASSEAREKQGFEPIELVGWAASPFYDAQTKKLHWAKEIKFGQQETNTLNYNIRVLGRKGVLVLNFIAGMNQKATVEENMPTVLAIAEFGEGAKYADFNPDIDEVAAYGVSALVAGKVIAKTGMLAVALVFLKKFGIFILIGIGVLAKGFFSRRKAKINAA